MIMPDFATAINSSKLQGAKWSERSEPPDVGQPKTPEGRLVEPINEEAIDNGYDSDGLQAPWVGNQLQSPDQIEAEEEALPFGSPPSLPAEAPLENFAEKISKPENKEIFTD